MDHELPVLVDAGTHVYQQGYDLFSRARRQRIDSDHCPFELCIDTTRGGQAIAGQSRPIRAEHPAAVSIKPMRLAAMRHIHRIGRDRHD